MRTRFLDPEGSFLVQPVNSIRRVGSTCQDGMGAAAFFMVQSARA